MSDLDAGKMEKRLNRVERWLKRCAAACKCGSWKDAVMEAECLEAETRGLREELWSAASAAENGETSRKFGFYAARAAGVGVLAAAMVLSAVIPLSTDAADPAASLSGAGESFAILSGPESDIISALRESLSSANRGRVVLSVELPPAEEVAKAAGAASAAEKDAPAAKTVKKQTARAAGPEIKTETVTEPPAEEPRRPSAEEVISLIQVGQRALRVSEPAVRVVP